MTSPWQCTRDRAAALFTQTFGTAPAGFAITPGRVNLIGGHTDYNEGFVLPCAADKYIVAAFSPRKDSAMRVVSGQYPEQDETFVLQHPVAKVKRVMPGSWSNYVRGVADVMLQHRLPLTGVSLAIASDLPEGAGLSSSAALEISVVNAFSACAGHALRKITKAEICRRAENEFAGCQCGIMDQLTVLHGRRGHAILLDCRHLAIKQASLNEQLALVVLESGVKHQLTAGGGYNERANQCMLACRQLNVTALRDVTPEQLESERNYMDPVIFRRAQHVISENKRVLSCYNALLRDDIAQAGTLMYESHCSLRDNFEVTIPETDCLAQDAQEVVAGNGGARMTGGGFGGSVLVLTRQEQVPELIRTVRKTYQERFGRNLPVHICHTVDGANHTFSGTGTPGVASQA